MKRLSMIRRGNVDYAQALIQRGRDADYPELSSAWRKFCGLVENSKRRMRGTRRVRWLEADQPIALRGSVGASDGAV